MNRRALKPLVLVAAATLAACVVNISFDMKKTFAVVSQTGTGGQTISQTQAVNLLDYKDVADHRDNIKSLDLDSATITVTTVNAGNGVKINGSVVVKKTAADTAEVVVGTLTNFQVAVGAKQTFQGSPALDQFLLDALHGDGKFVTVVKGSVDGATDVVLDATFHASVGYDAGIF